MQRCGRSGLRRASLLTAQCRQSLTGRSSSQCSFERAPARSVVRRRQYLCRRGVRQLAEGRKASAADTGSRHGVKGGLRAQLRARLRARGPCLVAPMPMSGCLSQGRTRSPAPYSSPCPRDRCPVDVQSMSGRCPSRCPVDVRQLEHVSGPMSGPDSGSTGGARVRGSPSPPWAPDMGTF